MSNSARSAASVDLSVVVPLYNEEQNTAVLVQQLRNVLDSLEIAYEVVLVNDGSADATWEGIQAAAAADGRVRGVCLSRNFGHQNAIFAGLHAARGRAVVTMDGDLQHPPATIPELYAAWQQGHEIVETRRLDSGDTSLFKRWTSRWFYRFFSVLSGIPMSAGTSDFRLMDRVVVDAMRRMKDSDLFLRGIAHWVGFRCTVVPYQAGVRHAGETKFSFARMVRFAAASLISFSTVPLRLGIWIGLVTSAVAFLELLYIVVMFLRGATVPGWASILGLMSLMFGILFILIGILGAYLGSVFESLKNRPRFLIRERTGFPE